MQRGFQYDVSRSDDVQQLSFLVRVVHPYQLLVECNTQGCFPTEFCHVRPLSCLDRLFDGVQCILREQFQFIQCLVKFKSPIRIHAQFQFTRSEAFTNLFQQFQFRLEVDGTYLQFDASEPLFQFLLDALLHLVERTHPHQSVDRNGESLALRIFLQRGSYRRFQIFQCRFHTKEHRGIVAHRFIVYLPCSLHVVTERPQSFTIVRYVVTTQLR